LKIWDIIFFYLGKLHNGPFLGIFRGGLVFFDPKNCPSLRSGQFRGQKSLGPLKISLEKAHYVVCPQKKLISRIFKISGALIVILGFLEALKVQNQFLQKKQISKVFFKI
jgi:hypothetical protein